MNLLGTTTTVGSLQKKSENIVSAFRKVVTDLTATNEEAMKLAAIKSAEVKVLQEEVHTLAALSEDNGKVINNLLKILG